MTLRYRQRLDQLDQSLQRLQDEREAKEQEERLNQQQEYWASVLEKKPQRSSPSRPSSPSPPRLVRSPARLPQPQQAPQLQQEWKCPNCNRVCVDHCNICATVRFPTHPQTGHCMRFASFQVCPFGNDCHYFAATPQHNTEKFLHFDGDA